MHTQCKLSPGPPVWIAGLTVCVLAALGTIAVVRWIPASHANIPVEIASTTTGTEPNQLHDALAEDTQVLPAIPRASTNLRNRARCSDCGIVESMRRIERSGEIGGHDAVGVTIAGGVSSSAPGSAIAANAKTGPGYEFTVRFRDGSTTVFNQASPHTWQLGSRVVVVGRSNASTVGGAPNRLW